MMDFFLPLFVYVNVISEFTSVNIGYDNGYKTSLHVVIDWKTRLEHKLSCKIQNKIPLGSLCN